jgi:hypothetical protein
MNRRIFLEGIPFWSAAINVGLAPTSAKSSAKPTNERTSEGRNRLPPSVPPEVVAWFWFERPEFQPDGFCKFIDLVADHTNFGMLTTSLRAAKHEITFPETHDQIKRAVQYAHQRGLKVALDVDVRFARGTFYKHFPDQQQWLLQIRAFPFAATGLTQVSIKSRRMDEGLSGRLMGVYRTAQSEPYGTVQPIRERCRALEESPDRITVEIPAEERVPGSELVVAAAFEYETPDVFAPDLLEFHRGICRQYQDVGLDGGMGADEWGFPNPSTHGGKDGEFWYSPAMAEQYRKAGGGDYVLDCILMALGRGGSYAQRLTAVNRYMQLILTRNIELEHGFYRHAKEAFGPDSFTGTHATWGFMPWGDAFRDGYDWWEATRDYGETDEHWPISVRTALAKKMGGSIWYNQFYAPNAEPYSLELWRNGRAGGRVNLHPLWPSAVGEQAYWAIFSGPFMRAESRLRLLNLIKPAPIDCPVAVVFGHAASLNWEGPHFGDLGEGFASELWEVYRVRADVIPSSEIGFGELKLTDDGWLAYGVQRYRVMVFLNPDFEGPETFDFLRRVARSQTQVFVRDETRLAPDGNVRRNPEVIEGANVGPTPAEVAEFLQVWHSPRQPSPPDLVLLTDGTRLILRGEKDPAGDRIDETFFLEYSGGLAKIKVGATGVFGIRLGPRGELQALAASDLRYVQIWHIGEEGLLLNGLNAFGEPTEKFHLEPPVPIDLALWRDTDGKQHGVIQGAKEIPQQLLQWTRDWVRMDLAPANSPKG